MEMKCLQLQVNNSVYIISTPNCETMSIPYEAAKSEVMAGYQSQSYSSEQAIDKTVAESIHQFFAIMLLVV